MAKKLKVRRRTHNVRVQHNFLIAKGVATFIDANLPVDNGAVADWLREEVVQDTIAHAALEEWYYDPVGSTIVPWGDPEQAVALSEVYLKMLQVADFLDGWDYTLDSGDEDSEPF